MKIYTRTGDEGTTGLLGGSRVAKSSLRMNAIGSVDELNATIGLVRVHAAGTELDGPLARIQAWLFDVGGELASPPDGSFPYEAIHDSQTEFLERSMDEQSAVLPPLRQFILPGGCPMAAQLHHARTVCRRAERAVVELHSVEPVRHPTRAFINRLADWLFVAARTANRVASVEDIAWAKSEDM